LDYSRKVIFSILAVALIGSATLAYAVSITAPEIPRFGDNGSDDVINGLDRITFEIIFNFTAPGALNVGDTMFLLNGTDALAANFTTPISHVVTQPEINQLSLNFTVAELAGLGDGNYILRGQWVDTVGDGDSGTQGDEAGTLTLDSDTTPTATLTPTPATPSNDKSSLSFAIQFSEPMNPGTFVASADLDISFNGGAFGNAAGILTLIESDSYTYTLSAGELTSIGTGFPSETVTLRLLSSVADTNGNLVTSVDSVWTFDTSVSGGGGSDQAKTKPTFGLDHRSFQPIVEGGFSFNGISHDITDNFWTPFNEKQVRVGTLNTFSAKVYADKGLRTQEFLFGIPEVGKAQDAEVVVEVWYDTQKNIIDTIVSQKTNVVDADSLIVKHSMNNCSSENNLQCDVTKISIKFLESLKDKVMAINAVDYKNRGQLTYQNEGFDVSGDSLNPMKTLMIPGPEKYEGLIEVMQVAKYSDIWIAQDGREFEMDKSGGFNQINESFERHVDSGVMKNRLHSEFTEYKQDQISNAMIVLQELCPSCISETFDEINDIFVYDFSFNYAKYNDPEIQATLITEDLKAKQTLDRLFEEWYPGMTFD